MKPSPAITIQSRRCNAGLPRLAHTLSITNRGSANSMRYMILRDARAVLPEVDRVDLYETRGSGALVTLGDTSELIPV